MKLLYYIKKLIDSYKFNQFKKSTHVIGHTLTDSDLRDIYEIKKFAIKCHKDVNHKLDNKPYSVHLNLVFEFACKYAYLLSYKDAVCALKSAWTHDTIEDCRKTYNDIKVKCGEDVADVTYALSNEKGKNRKERANDKYYYGIRKILVARFEKICDRLANTKYANSVGSKMVKCYKKEQLHFREELYRGGSFEPMFDEIESYFSK
jgi:(p)ppGpp synthase/HD superfamily hydrolase